jgi:putative protein-disulfide isomerase
MERKEANAQQINNDSPGKKDKAVGIEVIYYTDPLCCWSWVMEPQWRRLQQELGPRLQISYKMGGLLPSWTNFNDTLNSIRKPIHMGPEWMHAQQVSGVEINNSIWMTDPPSSSFPACIAVKTAELQTREAGAAYLQLLRQTVMVKAGNIARTEMLLDLALELSNTDTSFDASTFREDLYTRGKDAFKADWQETKYRGITRFPTLVFKSPHRPPIQLNGFQSYESLLKAAE